MHAHATWARHASKAKLASMNPAPARHLLLPHLVLACAACLWIGQAAALAWAVAGWQAGEGMVRTTWAAAWVVALGLLRGALEAWGTRRIARAARQEVSALRARLSAALAWQSPLDRDRPAAGAVASALGEQAEMLVPWRTRYHAAQWKVRLVLPMILGAVAWQSWLAALVLLVAAPLIPLFMALVGWRTQALAEAQMVKLGELNAFLLDRLRGMTTLRALGARAATARALHRHGAQYARKTFGVMRLAFLSSAVLEFFAALGVALVAVYVGFHLLGQLPFGSWGTPLDLAAGLFILLLAPAFFEPLRELAAAWHDRANGLAALARLQTLEATTDPPDQPDGATGSEEANTMDAHADGGLALRLDAVDFSHADGAPVLHNFSLAIAAGERVALAGASGRGKSVVLALLGGLVAPVAGTVCIGGRTLTPASLAGARAHIGWLAQRPHVLTASLRHNISLGRSDIDHAAVDRVVTQTGLAPVLTRWPHARLAEGGAGLSGGELARLALARLVAKPGTQVWLLDEPTAHLDRATALALIDALLTVAGPRTLVVATHDPLLLARLDRVIDLDTAEGVWRAVA